jgi:glycosyltransferase involved in cell wall biosynthesis
MMRIPRGTQRGKPILAAADRIGDAASKTVALPAPLGVVLEEESASGSTRNADNDVLLEVVGDPAIRPFATHDDDGPAAPAAVLPTQTELTIPAVAGLPPRHDAPAAYNAEAQPGAQRSLRGHIDEATRTTIRGWVWDPETPGERIWLELVEGEAQLATAVASDDRPDLALAGIGDGRHAFSIELKPGLLSEARHVLHLRCADAGAIVPGSAIVLEPSADTRRAALRWHLDQITDEKIAGWVTVRDEPSRHCVVALKEGGRILARAAASRFRADLLLADIGDGCYAFDLQMPRSLLDGKEHRLEIVEEDTGFALTEEPVQWRWAAGTAGAAVTGIGSEMLNAAGFPSPVRPAHERSQSIVRTASQKHFPNVSNCLALVATRNFLPFAKLTARSFLAHHPEFRVFVLLVDGEPPDAEAFTEGSVVFLSDLDQRHAEWYAAKFSASEFANALKPVFLRYLTKFATKVIYLDCDTAVFSRLTEMIDLLETHDLVLVPHMLTPPPLPERFWIHPTRADTFHAGLINAGCFAIRLAQCQEFLMFWEDANFAPGAFYDGAGSQTDQQHLNWALVTVPGTCVLRETRYNVAYWNLHERDLRLASIRDGDAQFDVDGKPLGFFHFSGYDSNDRLRLSRHDARHSVYNFPAVAEILNWYSDQIFASPTAGILHEPYRFDRLANGLPLNRFLRQLLKRYEAYIPKFDSQTVEGADGLSAFLMDPLPATRSMLPLIAAEIYEARPDLQHSFPGAHTAVSPDGFLRWFCRHAGTDFDIQFLVDCFRRSLTSDSLRGFAEEILTTLGDSSLQFLGADRMETADRLRALGKGDQADVLLEARTEWLFFSDLSAVFGIYMHRPDLQKAFPDILGRDHEAFLEWVTNHAPKEHGCPPTLTERARGRTSAVCLPRIFCYLSRQEHLADVCRESLLSDDPGPLLRDLLRDAGEGLEYDLDDVIVLRFIHQTSRHLLVPLYLELPFMRRQVDASRVGDTSIALLPEKVRNTPWAARGCEIHAKCFDRFEAYLDEEMRRWAVRFSSLSSDVLDFLRGPTREQGAIRMIEPAYRAAARRLGPDEAASRDLERRLTERKRRPGVNIFGYFASDIGVGESTRGLAQAVSLLRPVNRVPFCTSQLRDGTELSHLFQRFDYLSDTNVFVTYPHQREDLLGIMRPEHLAGRRNIAHLAWEQKDANPWWKVVYDRYEEIWTISEFAATPFRKMFPGRVRVVPNVLDFEQFPGCEELGQARLTGEPLKFLFVFDASSSMERKNPEGVIDAFIKAFKGTRHAKRVHLTLKVGGMYRPEYTVRVERLMRKASEARLAIHFDGRQLVRGAMLRLIAEADCYVSLHHAEGFGYTMAEAMFYGVPVIASGYSGNLEYMTPANSFLVPCKEAFVKDADGPFQRGSIWGDPDIDIAAALMRQLVENPSKALAIGECGRKTVIGKLSAAAVAETIKSCFGVTSRCQGEPTQQLAADYIPPI